jgi:ribosomal protein L28
MVAKNDNIIRLGQKNLSQLDPGGVLRSVHDDQAQGLRVLNALSEVPGDYNRVDLTYNSNSSITKAVFYVGKDPQILEIETVSDVAGSLNNTNFVVYSENNESSYYFWFNVDSNGVDPEIANSVGIEIPISENDSANFIAKAIQLVAKKLIDFDIQVLKNKIIIENSRRGKANAPVNNGTGFSILTRQVGTETVIKAIDIPFDGKVRYLFNTQEKKFVVESIGGEASVDVSAETGSTIAISGHVNPFVHKQEQNKLKAELSLVTPTEIYSYTTSSVIRIRSLRIIGDTMGQYILKLNNNTEDKFNVSMMERNANFSYQENLELPIGTEITVEFIPERIQIDNYIFFTRLEGYIP